jgi:hypothetical protein
MLQDSEQHKHYDSLLASSSYKLNRQQTAMYTHIHDCLLFTEISPRCLLQKFVLSVIK